MRNILCKKCEDKGFVGFFRKKTCPVCNGNPKSLLPPKPQIKPSGQKIDFIQAMQVLRLEPDDIIVLKCPNCLSDEARKRLKVSWKERFPDIKSLILEEGIDIGVLRKNRSLATEDIE